MHPLITAFSPFSTPFMPFLPQIPDPLLLSSLFLFPFFPSVAPFSPSLPAIPGSFLFFFSLFSFCTSAFREKENPEEITRWPFTSRARQERAQQRTALPQHLRRAARSSDRMRRARTNQDTQFQRGGAMRAAFRTRKSRRRRCPPMSSTPRRHEKIHLRSQLRSLSPPR